MAYYFLLVNDQRKVSCVSAMASFFIITSWQTEREVDKIHDFSKQKVVFTHFELIFNWTSSYFSQAGTYNCMYLSFYSNGSTYHENEETSSVINKK